MNNRPTWAHALNIPQTQLDAWTAEVPGDQPVLFYALERGLISAATYLAWAREHFALPTLESAFFVADCDFDLVRGAHELESYRPWFFPVGRWDDVIYVACVEPVDDMPPGYCLVLADARTMLETWTAHAEPSGTLLTFKLPIADEAAPAAEPEPEIPTGFHSGAPVLFTLNLDGLTLPNHEPAAPVAPKAPSIPAPVVSAPVAPAPKAPSVAAPVVEAPAPAPYASVASVGLVSSPDDRVSVPAPANTVARSFYSQAADDVRLNLPATEAGALTRVFDYLNENYANACVLRCTDSMIRLYKFSLGMTPSAQGVAIDLSYPSFLRIVSRTTQSYHGYVVDSPIHREFFRGLGINDLPASVTAAPLMIDGQLWGVLMATGRGDQQSAAALKPIENIAQQLGETLGPAWRKAAA